MSKQSEKIMSEENFDMLKKVVEMTYGNQEEIRDRAEGKGKNQLTSVLILKPIEHLSDQIVEFYLWELKSLGITNSTWDENLWAFRAVIEGNMINKLKEKGFIVLLDRKVIIEPDFTL